MNSKEIKEENNWQNYGTNLKEWKFNNNKYILENGLYSDVEFVINKSGEQEIFKAHKLELIKASSVFQTMFYGPLPQKTPIELDDVEPSIFKKFLYFIYLGTIELTTVADAWDLYKIADKYNVKLLLQEIGKKLQQLLEEDKTYCISSFEYAEHFGNEELKTSILDHITRNIDKIVKLESFLDAKLDTLLLIVKQPKLNISEIDLLQALNKYHETNCRRSNEHDNMKKIVREVRFLTFTLAQFLTVGVNSPLLTDTEKLQIIETINEIKPISQQSSSSVVCTYCRSNVLLVVETPINTTFNIQNNKMPNKFSLSTMPREKAI